jgi:acyl carrier protein
VIERLSFSARVEPPLRAAFAAWQRRAGVQPMSSLEEIQELLHTKYGIDRTALDPHASLRGHGIDSLALVEFLFAVEDHYGILVPEEHSNVDTLAALAVVVDEIRASQTA